jgi:MATE family multidrug resistance protein
MLAIAVPMTASHMTVPLLGLTDAAVIGRLGEPHLLGAVALGALVFDVLFWSLASLRMTTAAQTAQATGAGEPGIIDVVLARGLALALALGLVIVVAQAPIIAAALHLTGASPQVQAALAEYCIVRIWAAPFTLVNYVVLGSVLGRGRAGLGLALQVGMNFLNVALTIGLVLGAGLGVAGAAWGTLLAEIAGAVAGVVVLVRLGHRPWRVPVAQILLRAELLRTLAMNADVTVRTLSLMAVFGIFASLGARSGDVTLAANAVLQNMFMVGGFFLDGFATAAEVQGGQAYGARHERHFRQVTRLTLVWSLGLGLFATILFLVTGPAFIAFLTTSEDVRSAAADVLIFAAVTPLIGAVAFAFDGLYIGAGWTRALRNLMLLALAAFLGLAWLAQPYGNAGLWTAFLVFLGSRALGQALAYPALARASFMPSVASGLTNRKRI